MTRFIRDRLQPISLQRGRCLDKSAEASEDEAKVPRAVAGSLSWVARQCRPDEAGTASTLQSSSSGVVVKDISDANRAVNRLKQTENVGRLIHAIPLIDLRIVSISDTALDLDRPHGPAQGRLHVNFHKRTPPAGITRLVTQILVIAQSKAECFCASGWGGRRDEKRAG